MGPVGAHICSVWWALSVDLALLGLFSPSAKESAILGLSSPLAVLFCHIRVVKPFGRVLADHCRGDGLRLV